MSIIERKSVFLPKRNIEDNTNRYKHNYYNALQPNMVIFTSSQYKKLISRYLASGKSDDEIVSYFDISLSSLVRQFIIELKQNIFNYVPMTMVDVYSNDGTFISKSVVVRTTKTYAFVRVINATLVFNQSDGKGIKYTGKNTKNAINFYIKKGE